MNAPQADGATAIQWAAYRNDLALADVLITAGANVKTANRDGATALSLAAINGNAAMIEKLLKAGADPNERQPNGETPLMLASRNGNLDAIKVLLAHKADPNLKEKLRGTTALMWAAEQSASGRRQTAGGQRSGRQSRHRSRYHGQLQSESGPDRSGQAAIPPKAREACPAERQWSASDALQQVVAGGRGARSCPAARPAPNR